VDQEKLKHFPSVHSMWCFWSDVYVSLGKLHVLGVCVCVCVCVCVVKFGFFFGFEILGKRVVLSLVSGMKTFIAFFFFVRCFLRKFSLVWYFAYCSECEWRGPIVLCYSFSYVD